MNKVDAQRQKEIQQAEELLFAGPQALGFAKGLFQGHFVSDWVMPYPRISAEQQTELDETLRELRQFLCEHLDAAEIDRRADIPRSVIDGLGRIGVLGMTAPKEYGGRGFSQIANCKVLEKSGAVARPLRYSLMHITQSGFALCCCSEHANKDRSGSRSW